MVINQAWSNHGDEAAHKGLVRMLASAYPKAEITVLMHVAPDFRDDNFKLYRPEEFKNINYLKIIADRWYYRMVRYLWWMPVGTITALGPLLSDSLRQVKQLLRSADLVVNAPGGVDLGPYRNWGNVIRLLVAIQIGTPTAIYAISFGPLPESTQKDRRFSQLALYILRNVQYLTLRDDKSQKYASALKISFGKSADTAFLDDTTATIPSELNAKIQSPYAVFVPNALYKWHPHFREISSYIFKQLYIHIMEGLLAKNLRIVMLPQLFGSQNDESFFQELAGHFPDTSITVVSESYPSEIQQAIVRGAEITVGARYHSLIFAIKNNVPFVALSYEHKISNLLTMAGLSEYMVDLHQIETLAPKGICDQIDDILINRTQVTQQVADGHQAVLQMAEGARGRFLVQFSGTTSN